MAITVGDVVIPAAAIRGGGNAHAKAPLVGVVESLTPGAPPTDVTVDWANGERTEYATTGTGAVGAVLLQVLSSFPATESLIGYVVSTAYPNPGDLVQGPVVFHQELRDPSTGASYGIFCTLQTPLGYVTALASACVVHPSE